MLIKKKRLSNSMLSKKFPFGLARKFKSSRGNSSNNIELTPVSAVKNTPLFRKRSFLNIRNDSLETNDPECFHRSIGMSLLIAQYFGLLPIGNIRARSPKKFTFHRFAIRTIYCYIVIIGLSIMTALAVYHLLKTLNATTFQIHGGIASATAGAIFYGNSLCSSVLFWRLAPRWIPLQRQWRAMELFIDRGKWRRPNLRWKFVLITGVIIILAVTEHALSIVNNVPPEKWKDFSTFEAFIETYTDKSHHFIIRYVKYNFTLGLFIFFFSRIATFTWNFTDIFIMLTSTGLAERYRFLNARITEIPSVQFTTADWHDFREGYAILSALVKQVDNEISLIILLSFGNNLYFICLQLLNGLTPEDSSLVETMYFFGSFIFLIGRTVTVILCTARINDQSKFALPVVYSCPSSTYNIEVQRLQQQLATDDVALTGFRFFSITRNFMLAVIGAIVTYEIVLLQFNASLNNNDKNGDKEQSTRQNT